jgi:hypothetical protein
VIVNKLDGVYFVANKYTLEEIIFILLTEFMVVYLTRRLKTLPLV